MLGRDVCRLPSAIRSLRNCMHPSEQDTNPPKMECGYLCGGVIIKKKKKKCTHSILSPYWMHLSMYNCPYRVTHSVQLRNSTVTTASELPGGFFKNTPCKEVSWRKKSEKHEELSSLGRLASCGCTVETHSIENGCYRTRKYTVCRRVRSSFSPEILQAGAVKG